MVRSVKEECLAKLILFGETSLHRALAEFMAHFHSERNNQGEGILSLFQQRAGLAVTSNAENASAELLRNCWRAYEVLCTGMFRKTTLRRQHPLQPAERKIRGPEFQLKKSNFSSVLPAPGSRPAK